MADSATATLGLLLMASPSNSNNWITRLNNEVLKVAENAIAGHETTSLISGQLVIVVALGGNVAVLDIRFESASLDINANAAGFVGIELNGTQLPHPRVWLINNKLTTDQPQIVLKFFSSTGNVNAVIVPAGLHAVYIDVNGNYFVW